MRGENLITHNDCICHNLHPKKYESAYMRSFCSLMMKIRFLLWLGFIPWRNIRDRKKQFKKRIVPIYRFTFLAMLPETDDIYICFCFMYVCAKKGLEIKQKNKLTWKICWFLRNFGLILSLDEFLSRYKKNMSSKNSDYNTWWTHPIRYRTINLFHIWNL